MSGSSLSASLEALEAALQEGERSAIAAAVRLLREYESLPLEALPLLERLFSRPRLSGWMRRQAVGMLLRIEPIPPRLLSLLLEASDDEEEGWSQEIAQTILKRKIATFSSLASILENPSSSLQALRMGVRLIGEASSAARLDFASAFGFSGQPVLCALFKLLSHPDLRLSRITAWAISVWPLPLPKEGVPALTAALAHLDPQVACFAAGALASFESLPASASSPVFAALSYPYFAIRGYAALCLAKLSEAPKEDAIPLLLGMMRQTEAWERRCALEALGRVVSHQMELIHRLAEPLSDPDDDVCITAAEALRRLTYRAIVVLPALLEALQHPSWRRRRVLYHVIGQIGPSAYEATPALLRGLKEDRWRVRRVAAQALATLRPTAEQAEAALLAAFRDSHWEIREAIAEALSYLQNPSSDVIDSLLAAFHDPRLPVRSASARALGWLPTHAAQTVPALASALSSTDPAFRLAVVESLHRLGSLAAPATLALQACLAAETSPHLRSLVKQTLLLFEDPSTSSSFSTRPPPHSDPL